MWTEQHRKIYQRVERRYPSDMTDREWARLEPLIPPAKPGASAHDRYARSDQRHPLSSSHRLPVALSSSRGISAAFDRLQYLSHLPESWFQKAGTWDAIWEQLHMDLREDMGREASASARSSTANP
jgi:transposase